MNAIRNHLLNPDPFTFDPLALPGVDAGTVWSRLREGAAVSRRWMVKDGGRLGAIMQIETLIEFAESAGFNDGTLAASKLACDGLRELSGSPMVTGPKATGHPRQSVKRMVERMMLRAAADAFISQGMQVMDACRKVSRYLDKNGYPWPDHIKRHSADRAVTIKKWRDVTDAMPDRPGDMDPHLILDSVCRDADRPA